MIYSKIGRSILSQKLDAKISRVQEAESQLFNGYVDEFINWANVEIAKIPFKYRLPWSKEYLPVFIKFSGDRLTNISKVTIETLPENYRSVLEESNKVLKYDLEYWFRRKLSGCRYDKANEECRRIRLMILETTGDIEIDQDTLAFLEGSREV